MMKSQSFVLRILAAGLFAALLAGNALFRGVNPWSLLRAALSGQLLPLLLLLSGLLSLALIVCLFLPAVWKKPRRLMGLAYAAAGISAALRIAAYLNSWYLMARVYDVSGSDRSDVLIKGIFSYNELLPHLCLLTVLVLLASLLAESNAYAAAGQGGQSPDAPQAAGQ